MAPKYITNTTICNNGAFCNQLIRNICSSQLAQKYNLKFTYISYPETLALGIPLFIDGLFYYDTYMILDETKFEEYITRDKTLTQNIDVTRHFFQTPFISRYIRDYLSNDPIKTNIINHNKFRERYDNNEDLCVHVRLGDIAHLNPGLEFYENMITNKIPHYHKGYITSDTITHPICQELIQKYNLEILEKNAVETLMFSSTCKYLLLSGGTFSWMMGVLAFNGKVFYPASNTSPQWHGDIFVFNDWTKDT
jgi:hypothetical protein